MTRTRKRAVRKRGDRAQHRCSVDGAGPQTPEDAGLPAVVRRHGQRLRYLRGEIEVDDAAGDPDDPNAKISRARVSPAHHRLLSLGSISAEQAKAADVYGQLCEIESGARSGSGGHSVQLAAWQRSPTDRQVNAATKLRRMRLIWGPRARGIIDQLVLQNLGIGQIAETLRQNEQRTLGEVVAALDRCSIEWGIQARPRGVGPDRFSGGVHRGMA